MLTAVYDKTEKGREEIATRKYHLSSRLRTLLVMVDGNLTLAQLLTKLSGMGHSEDSIQELLRDEFIVLIKGGQPEAAVAAPAAAAPARALPTTARARVAARRVAGAPHAPGDQGGEHEGDFDAGPVTEPVPAVASKPAAPAAPAAPAESTQTDAERFRALYDFYNQTIKSTIGLRGMFLQLKVEKCANLEDFRELRKAYVEAVLKARGREMAMSLRDRLDHLLGGKPDYDDVNLPEH